MTRLLKKFVFLVACIVLCHANATPKIQPYNPSSTFFQDTVVVIKFKELSLSIKSLVVFDEHNKLRHVQSDTVRVYPEVGETIEGQQLAIETNQLTNIRVEQRYETSVVISDEGPHCDLIDWKHYTSDWEELNFAENSYIAKTYSLKERLQFPKVSVAELKTAVSKHCGKAWVKLIRNIKTVNESPIDVGISRHFLRITGKHISTGKTVTKLIIVEQPMGC